MENGYIKLWRNINKNELLANDNNAWNVFTRLLTLVDWKTGSYTTGRKKLAIFMNMNDRTLYGVLKRLEVATMLQMKSNKHATTFSICNWSKWQQELNTNATEPQTLRNTKQEVRKRSNNIYIASESENNLLEVLNRTTKRSFRVLPKSAGQTLKKFSLADIEKALTKLSRDEWHKSKIDTLSSDYLLRIGTIDKFLSANDTAKKFEKTYGARSERVDLAKLNLPRKQLAELEYKT